MQVAVEFLSGKATLWVDCKSVVDPIMLQLAGRAKFVDPRMVHGGFLRSMVGDPGWSHLEAIFKVRAHQHYDEDDDDDTRIIKVANRMADMQAKRGAGLHPASDPSLAMDLAHDERFVETLFKLAGAVLPELPRSRAERVAVKVGRRAFVWQEARGHRWHPLGTTKSFACVRCCTVASSRLEARRAAKCRGHTLLDKVVAAEGGHSLARVFTEGGTSVVCLRCGATMGVFPRLLLEPCKGTLARGGVVALSRMRSGRHPYQRADCQLLAVLPIVDADPSSIEEVVGVLPTNGSKLKAIRRGLRM